jgi:hypothetical protein
VILFAAVIILNRDLYLFFYRKRGLRFALLSIPMHLLFYIYSGVTFPVFWIRSKIPLFS